MFVIVVFGMIFFIVVVFGVSAIIIIIIKQDVSIPHSSKLRGWHKLKKKILIYLYTLNNRNAMILGV